MICNLIRVAFALAGLLVVAYPAYGQTLPALAQSMPPGTFALLNQEGDGSGYSASMTASGLGFGGSYTYASKAAYDPVRRRIYHYAAGHPAGSPMKFFVYEIDSNRWTLLPPPAFEPNYAGYQGHGYRLEEVAAGKFIRSWANRFSFVACNIDMDNVMEISAPCTGEFPAISTNPNTISRGWLLNFPERDALFWLDTAGSTRLYHKPHTSSTWNIFTLVPGLWGDGIGAVYVPALQALVFGGGTNGNGTYYRAWWMLRADGTLVRLDDAPIDTSFAGSSLLGFDPPSGKLLVVKGNNPSGYLFYEFNTQAAAGAQWTRRQDLEAGVPQLHHSSYPNSTVATLATTLPDYGVTVFQGYNKVWLYKHLTTAPTPDTTPPVIASPAAVWPTTATVTWTTNEPTTGRLEWGLDVLYGFTPIQSTPLKTAHSVTLTGLTPDTLYHLRIVATDAAGNQTTSTGYTVRSGGGLQ